MTTTNIVHFRPKKRSSFSASYGQPELDEILICRGMIIQYRDGRIDYTPAGLVMLAWMATEDEKSPHRDAFVKLFNAASLAAVIGNDYYNLSGLKKKGIDPAGDGYGSELLCSIFRLIALSLEKQNYDINSVVLSDEFFEA